MGYSSSALFARSLVDARCLVRTAPRLLVRLSLYVFCVMRRDGLLVACAPCRARARTAVPFVVVLVLWCDLIGFQWSVVASAKIATLADATWGVFGAIWRHMAPLYGIGVMRHMEADARKVGVSHTEI